MKVNENRIMSHFDLFKMHVGVFTNNDSSYKLDKVVREKSVDFMNNELYPNRTMEDIGVIKKW